MHIVQHWNRLTLMILVLITTLGSACTSAPGPGAASSPTSPFTGTLTSSTVTPAVSSAGFISAMAQVSPSVVIVEVAYPPGGSAQGAAGTGWIMDANGLIVTNDHVVINAQTITVTLSNGQKYNATGVQTDAQRDLAVIKIPAQNLTPASTGDSSKLQPGQPVAAVGNSLDMGIRITGGLVSRLNTTATYSITGQLNVTFNNLIETDAAINPGNSGGPLIDSIGQVIGIVNAGLTGPSTDVEGFGYAIPINDAIPIVNQLASQLQ